MNNEYSYLTDMQQNCKLYGMVEIDQLRAVWKARKFAIQVPDSIVQSGLLPSIFDWQLLGQLMPAEQATAEVLLQQRINDLELMNSLTTSLQRIQILPETGLEVDVIMGRPSYNVLVQDDGSILVKELPSLHIRVFTTETRPAAGQESSIIDEPNRISNSALVAQKAPLFKESGVLVMEDASKGDHADRDRDRVEAEPELEPEPEHEESTDDEATELAHEDANDELADFAEFLVLSQKADCAKLSELDLDMDESGNGDGDGEGDGDEDENDDDDDDDEASSPTEDDNKPFQQPIDTRMRRRQPFWIRFGNWLRQSLPRLNQ